MNPWGAVIILLGALAIYIGVKGTENKVYAFIFGHAPVGYNNTPFAPQGNASQSSNNSGIQQGPTVLNPRDRNSLGPFPPGWNTQMA